MTHDEQVVLEQLIDKYGVVGILGSLSDICCIKADHIASNYQDNDLSMQWAKMSEHIDKAHTHACSLNL